MPVRSEPARRLWVIACLATATAGVLLAVPFLLMGPSTPHDDSYVDGPVIATGGGRPWPLAGVTGRLTLEQGCLLLAGDPVYWPNGTSWDATTQEVVFSDGSRLGLGSRLSGGGGGFSGADLAAVRPNTRAVSATLACIRRTDSEGATFAYPSLLLDGG